jgi:hypothetical protein
VLESLAITGRKYVASNFPRALSAVTSTSSLSLSCGVRINSRTRCNLKHLSDYPFKLFQIRGRCSNLEYWLVEIRHNTCLAVIYPAPERSSSVLTDQSGVGVNLLPSPIIKNLSLFVMGMSMFRQRWICYVLLVTRDSPGGNSGSFSKFQTSSRIMAMQSISFAL